MCPYCKCKCRRFLDIESIRYHLYKDEFKPNYWVLTEYREAIPMENRFDGNYVKNSLSRVHVGNEEDSNIT